MAVPTPVFLLLAAFICSLVGRAYLFRAALSISKAWGIAVIFVPFAPFFFRRNYKELAHEGRGWQTWAMICGLMFFAVTGSTGSFNDLWALVPDQLRPPSMRGDAELLEPNTNSDALVAASEAPSTALPSTALPPTAALPPSVAPSPTALPPTPVPLSYAERIEANQQEFARLGGTYESLKLEKGYLRKHDDEGIRAYNAAASKYQADLAKARAEQTELNKLVLAKK